MRVPKPQKQMVMQPPNNKITYAHTYDEPVKRFLINALEAATGRKKIRQFYREILEASTEVDDIWEMSLEKFEIDLHYDEEKLESVPKEGPVVFVANHPFGLLDGLILGYLISRVRNDFVIMITATLYKDTPLEKYFLPVDFRENRDAAQLNIRTRNRAIDHLKEGKALAIFPAGAVATAPKPFARAEEWEWKRFVVKAIQQSSATVVPIFFEGQNSRLFQVVSQFSIPLRQGLFIHELKNKIGRQLTVRIGDPIPYEALAPLKERQAILDHLKEKTISLATC